MAKIPPRVRVCLAAIGNRSIRLTAAEVWDIVCDDAFVSAALDEVDPNHESNGASLIDVKNGGEWVPGGRPRFRVWKEGGDTWVELVGADGIDFQARVTNFPREKNPGSETVVTESELTRRLKF